MYTRFFINYEIIIFNINLLRFLSNRISLMMKCKIVPFSFFYEMVLNLLPSFLFHLLKFLILKKSLAMQSVKFSIQLNNCIYSKRQKDGFHDKLNETIL